MLRRVPPMGRLGAVDWQALRNVPRLIDQPRLSPEILERAASS
jgi:hypothetical protein